MWHELQLLNLLFPHVLGKNKVTEHTELCRHMSTSLSAWRLSASTSEQSQSGRLPLLVPAVKKNAQSQCTDKFFVH